MTIIASNTALNYNPCLLHNENFLTWYVVRCRE